jgi:predicted DNA-binding transcriptional regulator YafY
MRDGFRVFRLDRMTDFAVLDVKFEDVVGRTAEDFLKQDAKRKLARLSQSAKRGPAKEKSYGADFGEGERSFR